MADETEIDGGFSHKTLMEQTLLLDRAGELLKQRKNDELKYLAADFECSHGAACLVKKCTLRWDVGASEHSVSFSLPRSRLSMAHSVEGQKPVKLSVCVYGAEGQIQCGCSDKMCLQRLLLIVCRQTEML
ncbi:E3 14.7K [Tree shrew adenovirus 1]|uniref:E3 14.7K n=1 Tax=Tree shrew adenovirus serotype 1 TaxID=47680 RepID=A0A2U9AGA0_ADET1|nr:E3 14.7K [Tree shrew adenovirus 1]